MLVAIGCLYVAGGAAIIYLIEEALLRRRKTGGVLGRLPSLAALDRLIYHATLLGLPFLTMGMAAGVIRAETFKVPGWPTDPMVLLSAAAWARVPGAHRRPRARRLVRPRRLVARRRRVSSCCSSSASPRSRTSAASTPTGAERMHVVVAGISHKTASLELRERLALDEEAALRLSQELLDEGVACEAVALSTCNRTELYLYGRDSLAARQAALGHLARHAGVAPGELEPALYSYSGDGAIAHLFRVTSSLDSMVVGEAQIVAQLKAAYQQACDGGCTAVVFNRLFRHALEVGKRVRTETAIGERPVSVSSAAVELALQVFGKLRDHTVLIVGAGETSELTATHLKAHGIEKILVANRTLATSDGAGPAGRRRGGAVRGPRDAPRRRRHRHQLHLGAALRRHQGGRRARLQAPPAPAHVPHRHRRAARPRPRDQPRARRLPLRHRRPAARGRAQPPRAREGGAARRAHRRAGARERERLAAQPRGRAHHRDAARGRGGDPPRRARAPEQPAERPHRRAARPASTCSPRASSTRSCTCRRSR